MRAQQQPCTDYLGIALGAGAAWSEKFVRDCPRVRKTLVNIVDAHMVQDNANKCARYRVPRTGVTTSSRSPPPGTHSYPTLGHAIVCSLLYALGTTGQVALTSIFEAVAKRAHHFSWCALFRMLIFDGEAPDVIKS